MSTAEEYGFQHSFEEVMIKSISSNIKGDVSKTIFPLDAAFGLLFLFSPTSMRIDVVNDCFRNLLSLFVLFETIVLYFLYSIQCLACLSILYFVFSG